ncbi:DUF2439 domain-containing protein [Microdochium nivale]|nr:DUF2439 domain-containing protein [Microdochium nivale]
MQSSAASPASTASAASTAPIYEFACLFTHDLRRKSKRWQDGRLKYHAFNNRVVVHDERGNFVGDTHWREEYSLEDGEELTLDRGGVIVQVNECVATRNQDLSELVDKRKQQKAERQSAAAARIPAFPRPAPSGLPTPTRSLYSQASSKPLRQVVGTPTGHLGRAVIPTESPFEQRQKLVSPARDDASPQVKRQKRAISPPSKSGYAQSLFGAALSLSSQPMSSAPLRVRSTNTSAMRHTSAVLFSSPAEAGNESSPISSEPPRQPKAPGKSIATGSMGSRAREALPSLLQGKPIERLLPKARKSASSKHLKPDEEDGVFPLARVQRNEAKGKKRTLATLHKALDQHTSPPTITFDDSEEKAVIEIRSSNEIALPMSSKSKEPMTQSREKTKTKKPKAPTKVSEVSKRLSGDVRASAPSVESTTKSSKVDRPEQAPIGIQDDQPRTELRIKPRKKRGLLMLATVDANARKKSKIEQHPDTSRIAESLVANIPTHRTQEETDTSPQLPSGLTRKRKTKRQEKATIDNGGDIHLPDPYPPDKSHEERTADFSAPAERSRKSRSGNVANSVRKTELVVSDDDLLDDVDFEAQDTEFPCHETQPRTSRGIDAFEAKSLSAPRLARFARRGINSKEVIGLRFDDDGMPDFSYFTGAKVDHKNVSPCPQPAQTEEQLVLTSHVVQKCTDDEPMADFQKALVSNEEPSSPARPGPEEESRGTIAPLSVSDTASNARAAVCSEKARSPPAELALSHNTSVPVNEASSPKSNAASARLSTTSNRKETVATLMGSNVILPNTKADSQLSTEPPKEVSSERHTGSPDFSSIETARSAPSANSGAGLRASSAAPPESAPEPAPEPVPEPASEPKPKLALEAAPEPVPEPESPSISTDFSHESNVPRPLSTTEAVPKVNPPFVAPRRVNPATKGRKAARPSDAAGQTPQCPLPADSTPQTSSGLARLRNAYAKPTLIRSASSLSSTTPAQRPGFERASGGPWSREAYDLFEYQRPG